MKTGAPPVHRIELRLRELAQLFNSMDPTPFHHKDLDPDIDVPKAASRPTIRDIVFVEGARE